MMLLGRGLLLLVIALCWRAAAGQCTVDTTVATEDKPIVKNVITMLQPIDGKVLVVTDGIDTTYTVGICTVASKAFHNSAVILNDDTVVGLLNRTLAVVGDNWLQVWFLSNQNGTGGKCVGQNRSASILITCDPDLRGPDALTLSIRRVPGLPCLTLLSGHHSLACNDLQPRGLGGFSIFVIIVVVCFAAYFLFGFLYLRFLKGAKGVDQIPNHSVWFRVGNTFADCAGVVCRCDKYCGSNVRATDDYSSVGGSEGAAYSDRGPPYPSGGYQGGFSQAPGQPADRDELLAPRHDADLIQP